MVSHDFARGTIRGLPPSVVSAARKTGKLPEGAVPALMVDSWNAVLGVGGLKVCGKQ